MNSACLPPSGGDHFLAPVVGAEVGRVPLHDGVAQFGRSGDRRVLGEVPLDGRDGSVLDVLRRGEVRLACAEVDHVHPLCAQLVGFGDHRHGGGGLDAVDAFGQLDGLGRFRVVGVMLFSLPWIYGFPIFRLAR